MLRVFKTLITVWSGTNTFPNINCTVHIVELYYILLHFVTHRVAGVPFSRYFVVTSITDSSRAKVNLYSLHTTFCL